MLLEAPIRTIGLVQDERDIRVITLPPGKFTVLGDNGLYFAYFETRKEASDHILFRRSHGAKIDCHMYGPGEEVEVVVRSFATYPCRGGIVKAYYNNDRADGENKG